MADLIVGYPAKITVSGNNIVFAAGEFDAVIFSRYTTADYLANVTLGVPASKQITAIPGLQSDGTFIFTVADSSGWTTNDRVSPQTQSGISWYLTITAAYAAAANSDTFLLWYPGSANKSSMWTTTVYNGYATTMFSMYGMLAGQRVVIAPVSNTVGYYMRGALPNVPQTLIENITFDHCDRAVAYYDTGGPNAGNGVRVTRCRFVDNNYGFWVYANKDYVCQVDNSIFIRNGSVSGGTGESIYAATKINVYSNTVVNSFRYGIYGGGAILNCKNNLVMWSGTADYNSLHASSVTATNVSSDATSPNGASYQGKDETFTKFTHHNSNGKFPDDWRVIPASSCVGAGTVVAGVTRDIDGQDISGTASIGASAGCDFEEIPIVSSSSSSSSESSNSSSSLSSVSESSESSLSSGSSSSDSSQSESSASSVSSESSAAYCSASDVRYGIDRGDGTLGTCRVPLPGKVVSGELIDATVGTRVEPNEDTVKIYTVYGDPGDPRTGTYNPAGDPPAAPTLTVVDNADGTGVTFTVSGSDVGSENDIYYFADTATSTAVHGAEISGDGSDTIAISDMGTYWFFCKTETSSGYNVSWLVRVDATNGGASSVSALEDYIYEHGVVMTVEAKTEIVGTRGERESTWAASDLIQGWKQPVSSSEKVEYEKRGLSITSKIFMAENPSCGEGDRIGIAGKKYVIRGVTDMSGEGTLWRVDCDEVL